MNKIKQVCFTFYKLLLLQCLMFKLLVSSLPMELHFHVTSQSVLPCLLVQVSSWKLKVASHPRIWTQFPHFLESYLNFQHTYLQWSQNGKWWVQQILSKIEKVYRVSKKMSIDRSKKMFICEKVSFMINGHFFGTPGKNIRKCLLHILTHVVINLYQSCNEDSSKTLGRDN